VANTRSRGLGRLRNTLTPQEWRRAASLAGAIVALVDRVGPDRGLHVLGLLNVGILVSTARAFA
jgi:hypothetical protein